MNDVTAGTAGISQRSQRLITFVENPKFKFFIMALIVISAILLGLETSRSLSESIRFTIVRANQFILVCFVIEIALRISAYGKDFFRDSWSLFDFIIVAAALFDPTGPFQVVRSLRILRAIRLVSSVPSLRRVVEGLFGAVPGIASVLFLLVLVLYIAAVMATVLFRDIAPENFGHLGLSLFSLFQIMTLEGWSDIAQTVMEVYPLAWIYFIGYILIATFLVLNLIIGVVVGSIQSRIEAELAEENAGDEAVKNELIALQDEIRALRKAIDENKQ